MAYYLISEDFASYLPETEIVWTGTTYYYNTEDSDKNPAFSELGMGLNVASGDEVTVLAGDYEVIMSSGWYTNSGTITISNLAYSETDEDVFADTSVDIQATLKNNGTLVIENVDPAENPSTVDFSIAKLTNAGTVSIAGALVDATTFTNNGSVSIANTAFDASSVTNGEGKTFTLENSTFTALNTIVNDGTFYVTNSDVYADFDGGEISLTGTFGDDTDITGAADITATSVTLNGTASIEGSKLTVAGTGIDLNGTASLFADEVVVNSRIYANGVNTLDLSNISGSAIISARTGATLANSSIDRTVFFSDKTTISGDSYIKIISIKGTSTVLDSAGYRSLTITGDLESDKIDTGTSSGDKPNSAFITFDEADATLGALSITKDSIITVDNSSVTATSVILSGNIVVLGDSSLNFASITPSSAAIGGASTINAGGATLSDTSIAKTSATFAVAEATTLTLKGENSILANIDNQGIITLASKGTGDEFEAAFLEGSVSTGNIVIAEGAVVLDNDPETAAPKSAQLIKGTVSAEITNNAGYNNFKDSTGYYLTVENRNTLFVNPEYELVGGSAVMDDGHILGYNAFNSFTAAMQAAAIYNEVNTISLADDITAESNATITLPFSKDLTIGGPNTATINFSGNNDLIITVTEDNKITLAEGTTLKTTGADGYIVLGGDGSYQIDGTVDSVSQVAFWTDATVTGSVVSEYTGANTGMVLFRSAKQGSGDGVVINGGSVDTGRAFLVSGKLTTDEAEFNATVLEFTQNLDEASATPWWASEVVNENGEALLGAKFVLTSTDSVWTIGSIDAASANAKIDGEFTFTGGSTVNVSGNANLGEKITLKLSSSTFTAGELVNDGTVSVRGADNTLNITDLDGRIAIETAGGNTTLLGSKIGDTDETKNGIVEINTSDSGKGVYFKGLSNVSAKIENNGRMYVGASSGEGFLTFNKIENKTGAALTVRNGSQLGGGTIVNTANNTLTVNGTLDGVTVQGGSIATTSGFTFAGASKLEGVTINKPAATLTVNGNLTVDTASTITVDSVTVAEGGSITITAAEGFEGIKQIFILDDADTAAALLPKVTGDGVFVAQSGIYIYAAAATPETQDTIVVDVEVAGKTWGYAYEVGGQTYFVGINAFSKLSDALSAASAANATTIKLMSDAPEDLSATSSTNFAESISLEGGKTATLTFSGNKDIILSTAADKTFTLAAGTTLETEGADGYIVLSGAGSYEINGTLDSVSQVAFWTGATVSTTGKISSVYTAPNTGMVLFRSANKGGDAAAVTITGDATATTPQVTAGRTFLVSGKLTTSNAKINAGVIDFTQNVGSANEPIWASEVVDTTGESPVGKEGKKFVLESTNTNWTIAAIEDKGDDVKIKGEFGFTGGKVKVSGDANLNKNIELSLNGADMEAVNVSNAGTINLSGNSELGATGTVTNVAGGVINVGKADDAQDQKPELTAEGNIENYGTINLTGKKVGELITRASLEAAVIDNDGTIDAKYATITAGEISNAGTFKANNSTITVAAEVMEEPSDYMFFNEDTATALISNSTLTAGYLKGSFTLVNDDVTAQIVAGTLSVSGSNTLALGTKDGDTQTGNMSGATILLNLGAKLSGSIYAAGDAATFTGGKIVLAEDCQKATIGDLDAAKTQLVNEKSGSVFGLDIKGEAILAGVNNTSNNTINIVSTAATETAPAIDASLTAHAIDNSGTINVGTKKVGTVEGVAASLTGTTITNSGIVNVYENSTVEVKAGIVNHSDDEDTPAQFNLKAGSTITGANGVYMNLGNGVFNVNGATVSKLGINTAYDGAPSGKAEIVIKDSVIDLGTSSKSSAIIATKANTFTIEGESTVVARINGTVTLLNGTTLTDSTFAKYGSKPASTTVVADEAKVTFSGTNSIGKLTVGTDAEITVDGTLTSGTITNNGTITIDGSLSASAISKLGDIVMDATDDTTDTLTVTNAIAGEGTIAITIDDTFVAGTTLITAGSGLLDTTITINEIEVGNGDTVLGAYTVVLTDELLTLVELASTETLYVNKDYSATDAGGHAWGVNAFDNLVSAVAGMASDTTTINVTSSAETTGLTNLTVAPKAAALDIVGATAGVATEVELGFADGDNGLFLNAGVTVGKDVTIQTLHNNSHEDNGAVYLNFVGDPGTVTVDGMIDSGAAIKIYGDATITGTLSSNNNVVFNAGNGNVVNDADAVNSAVTIKKFDEDSNAPVITAENIRWISGDVKTTGATISATAGFVFLDSKTSKAEGNKRVDDKCFVDNTANLISTNTDWTVGYVDISRLADLKADGHGWSEDDPNPTEVKITFDGGQLKVTGSSNGNTLTPATEAAEIGSFVTVQLKNAAKLDVSEGTLKNDGSILSDKTATFITAKDIVNGKESEMLPEEEDLAVITGSSINVTGTVTNYGVIGQTNNPVTGLTADVLENFRYVRANTVEAKEIFNGEDAELVSVNINAGVERVTNSGIISAVTINSEGAIWNEGEITVGEEGSITATHSLVLHGSTASIIAGTINVVKTDLENSQGNLTNDGIIEAGSIVAGGTIGNDGTIEAGSVSATYIENSGTFTASGEENVVSGKFNNMAGGSVTLEDGVSLGTADAKISLIGNSKNAAKFEVLNASVYATQLQNLADFTVEGTTATATFNVGTVRNTSTLTFKGNVALTIGTIATGTGYKGITLDGANLFDASVGGAYTTTVDTDSAFNGKSSFSSLTVDDDAKLTINAAEADCLTVTDLNSTGSIYLHAEDDLFAETNLVRVITVSGEFNVGPITTDDGYSVIIQGTTAGKEVYLLNGAPTSMATIVLDITWGNQVPIGEKVNFGGNEYTYGVDAFTWATQLVNLTAETTTIKFRTSGDSYGALNLARANVSGLEEVAPLDVTVTRVDGTGVGTTAVFGDTTISTDVDFDVKDITFGALTISGSTVTFDVNDTQNVIAGGLDINNESEVDFEGNVTINGGAAITGSRVNFGEEDKDSITTISGNVTITDADVDFDDVTKIGIEGSEEPVLVTIEDGSEVEFDRNTTIYGSLTLEAGSMIEANQGYTFKVSGATINGALLVGNEDDENDDGNTAAELGAIVGGGTIYTDISSDLTFDGLEFTGKVSIDVSGLKAVGSGNPATTFAITGIDNPDTQFVVTGDGVANGTLFSKYFDYDNNSGLIQKGRAANVYEATVSTQTQINDAVSGTGWNADGGAVDPTYFVDNVTLTGDFAYVKTGEGLTSVYLGVNDDQNVILNGKFGTAVYGGEIYGSTTSRAGKRLGGDITVTVDGGTYSRVVVGGDRISVASGRANFFRSTDEEGDKLAKINLTINGGLFKSYIATGVMYEGENLQGSVDVGSTNLKISGGTFAKDVYGGNYGTKKAASSCTFAESSNVTLTVGGAEKINMAGCLFVGSFGSGKVQTTKLTLAGKSADALVVKEIWGGCGSDYYKEEGTKRTYETAVTGDRKLSFTGFDAEISASRIAGFSSVEVLGNGEELLDDDRVDTNATLQETVKLSDVENWAFEAGSTLNGAFINDFAGDKLTLTGIGEYFAATERTSWTLFGDTTNFTGFADFESVKYVNGELTIGFNYDEGAWVAADNSYMLSIDEKNNAMVLSTIA